MAPKRVYTKKAKQFPTSVPTPTNDAEWKTLSRSINQTQADIKRWKHTHPENSKAAEVFLELQMSARSLYKNKMSKEEAHEEAVAHDTALKKDYRQLVKAMEKFAERAYAASSHSLDFTASRTPLSRSGKQQKTRCKKLMPQRSQNSRLVNRR